MAAAPGAVHPAVVSLRFAGPIPAGIAERVRDIAQIDPALQMRRIVPLSNFYEELRSAWRLIAWAAAIVTITALLLSAAGIALGLGAALLATVAVLITIVATFAALGPARRSLRLPTVDVLRIDGYSVFDLCGAGLQPCEPCGIAAIDSLRVDG